MNMFEVFCELLVLGEMAEEDAQGKTGQRGVLAHHHLQEGLEHQMAIVTTVIFCRMGC
jgi:hypothetical protein